MKYTLVYSKRYERSFKRLLRSGLSDAILKRLRGYVHSLAAGEVLPSNAFDHKLTGDMNGYREFHVGGDLLVVYSKHEEVLILEFVDIGSHSQLFS